MKIVVAIAFYLIFWGCCFLGTGTDKKNLAGLRSYPEEVQRCVRENSELADSAPGKKPVWMILLSNLLVFTVVFTVIGLAFRNILGLNGFLQTFLYFLALGEGLGLFDLVIIDLLWWRNSKRIRFSFLPVKEPYQDPKMHIDSFLRGIPLFAVIAALTAAILVVQ